MSDKNPAARGQRRPAAAEIVLPEEQPPPVVEWSEAVEESRAPDAGFKYDGSVTKLPLAFPIMRDHVIVGPPDSIFVRAVQHPLTRRWHGPEAAHVEDLFRSGSIAGTRQARERAAETTAVEHARGVHTPQQGHPLGRQDLRALSVEDVQRQWERVLGRGPEEVIRSERREARSEASAAQDMAKAAAELARASRVIETLVTAKERLPQGTVGGGPEE